MVTTIKVLKRKDAASLVVGIVIALIIVTMLSSMSANISSWLSGLGYNVAGTSGGGWKEVYLNPFISALVQLIGLEVVVWVYANFHYGAKK